MKKFLLVFLVLLVGCTFSPPVEQIEEATKKSMAETYLVTDVDWEVLRVDLVHKGGNEYVGFADIRMWEGEARLKLEVINDGESLIWQTKFN